MNITDLLEKNYQSSAEHHQQTRKAWLAESVFGTCSYDDDMAEWFADIIIAAASIISKEAVLMVDDEDEYRNYLIAVNLPFFDTRLNWGTSIRGAWWDDDMDFDLFGDIVRVKREGVPKFWEMVVAFVAKGDAP